MLSNRGNARLSFILLFFVVFFGCIIYFTVSTGSSWFKSKFKSSNYDYESELKKATEKYITKYYTDLKQNCKDHICGWKQAENPARSAQH